MTDSNLHFNDKDAIGHVVEAQARGAISAAEIHGVETPGFISAAADAARDTAVVLLLFPLFSFEQVIASSIGWIAWKAGRAAWLGWARLERLHRVLEQERWEIEHNRAQERDELRELYRAKGFEGKLLEDVLDVLMADGERLLRVMVEEEMGLSLANVEHPLKQGLGAGLGALFASSFIITAAYFLSLIGLMTSALITIAVAAAILANGAKNKPIPAIIWNMALGLLAFGLTFYTVRML
jgi:hypothetical protein